MLRQAVFFLTIGLLLAAVPAVLWADDDSSARRSAWVNPEMARVRSGPGTHYGVVATLSQNEKVTIIGSQAGWSRIRMNDGRTGWVSSRHLRLKPRQQAQQESQRRRRRARTAPPPGPKWVITPKVGLAFPFFAAMCPAVEADAWLRIYARKKVDLYLTGSLGYSYMYINTAFGGKPDLEGHWAPAYVGMLGTLRYFSSFTPYLGGGVGANYYRFQVNEEDTDLDLSDENVHGMGLGGRAQLGVIIPLSIGEFVLENQLHVASIDEGVSASDVVYLGYRFKW